MLFSIGFLLTFVVGGLSGLLLGNVICRCAAFGHLLRGGAFSHGDGSGAGAGDHGRHVPVPAGDWAIPASRHGTGAFLDHLRWHLSAVAAAQLVFLWNLVWSAATVRVGSRLEWQAADMPPRHGNWGERLPVVHSWAFDYSLPGEAEDFVPQTQPERRLQDDGASQLP